MATYLATWGAPGPRVFHAPVPSSPPVVIQPGAVDSPRISDTAFRRKKKRQIETIGQPAAPIVATSVVTARPFTKPPDFRTLAELSGKSVEAFRAEIDQEIAQLLQVQQERDDEEAFTLILAAFED